MCTERVLVLCDGCALGDSTGRAEVCGVGSVSTWRLLCTERCCALDGVVLRRCCAPAHDCYCILEGRTDPRVFGRAVGGLEVIHSIENVKTDKNDRPLEDVRMMSITIE